MQKDHLLDPCNRRDSCAVPQIRWCLYGADSESVSVGVQTAFRRSGLPIGFEPLHDLTDLLLSQNIHPTGTHALPLQSGHILQIAGQTECLKATMGYINKKIDELDEEHSRLKKEIADMSADIYGKKDVGVIKNYLNNWESISISDKITVVDALIESVRVNQDTVDIVWKI